MSSNTLWQTVDNAARLNSLPCYQFGQLEISLSYDPTISSLFLLMHIRQRDSRTLMVIDAVEMVCRALNIETTAWQRHIYVREMCSMLSPHVDCNRPMLSKLAAPFQLMTTSWNIIGVFLWLQENLVKSTEPILDETMKIEELTTDKNLILSALAHYEKSLQPATEILSRANKGDHEMSEVTNLDRPSIPPDFEALRARINSNLPDMLS